MRHIKKGDEDACWPYQGRIGHFGYGVMDWRQRPHRAHRLMYMVASGKDIPDGLEVCHSCDNPPCCNPKHLWLGTHQENMVDCHQKGRANPRRGVEHPRAKLTDADIRAIRGSAKSTQQLAAKYGVSSNQIRIIRLRKNWKHVEQAA